METETRFPEMRFRFHHHNEVRSRSRLALTTNSLFFSTKNKTHLSRPKKLKSTRPPLLECLTAACKALSLANAKGMGTNGLVIRSLDD